MEIQRDPVAGLRNWAGNHAYIAARLLEPESLERYIDAGGSASESRQAITGPTA